ncbi:hypothetical protein A2697_02905 [Candidatus Curtissbacteria bacterium RIFCSPHIGHO2_01_FULL_41_44]|nr:MAG: hypothetical protein A2697_02905 [Candidatus Curtissbacteria bacterium RIFCSPHIGHO2_01_FULL_41_44]OGD93036.1 MAG: hypothetical protein A3C33_01085 [Candidatus Curtissbacteria bacterium RIFCSPHIGHO2_02_FULL_42_58]OGE03069.1 MAG: hypothetical protein A3G16_04240 [Candidatus Curtissbacteria bacterium RIFCSPLOWO2_12_FULL_41_16]OGE09922.1 MAG: hypothetical protein A3H87_04530 [Candidatus Curtissbacteria bacterium RIFCSPLOWO2_02_FULL_42_37]
MRKILLLALMVFGGILGYVFIRPVLISNPRVEKAPPLQKRPILRVALIADSHNENDLLEKALRQAQGMGINFVIGLGDYTNLGMIAELEAAKREFDKFGLQYFVIAGDRDGWESRNRGDVDNFGQVFGQSSQVFDRVGVSFVLLDNSDIYLGVSDEDWQILTDSLKNCAGPVSSFLPAFGEARLRRPTSARLRELSGVDRQSLGELRAVGTPSRTTTRTDFQRICFVFAHKTPFHPESKHVMGEDSPKVARQAQEFLKLLEGRRDKETEETEKREGKEAEGLLESERPLSAMSSSFETLNGRPNGRSRRPERSRRVDGFFSGDLHFFAKYQSPNKSVKITTIGAIASDRNFQGPRFAILTVWDDYSWEVEDIEIR